MDQCGADDECTHAYDCTFHQGRNCSCDDKSSLPEIMALIDAYPAILNTAYTMPNFVVLKAEWQARAAKHREQIVAALKQAGL